MTIPKIIHIIWLDGYNNLPDNIKLTQLDIKNKNPGWDFMIWDKQMINNLLSKNPKLQVIYKKYPIVAKYAILKEYGGLFFDNENMVCIVSFNKAFSENDNDDEKIIYTSDSFDAFPINHPIWSKVFDMCYKEQNVNNALDKVLENSIREYKIVNIDKKYGSVCHSSYFNNIILKQIGLGLLCFLIIFGVHYIVHHNNIKFGLSSVPFIPGVTIPSGPSTAPEKKHKIKKR